MYTRTAAALPSRACLQSASIVLGSTVVGDKPFAIMQVGSHRRTRGWLSLIHQQAPTSARDGVLSPTSARPRASALTLECSHFSMTVNDKRTLYVGGLEESVTEATLRAAFVPFGEVTDINMPLDNATQKHRGFAFVQYDEKEDAADAIDNMNNAELFGRVLKVNLSKPDAMKGGHRPVWESQADKFFGDDGKAGGAGD